jgi:hypothetical protein
MQHDCEVPLQKNEHGQEVRLREHLKLSGMHIHKSIVREDATENGPSSGKSCVHRLRFRGQGLRDSTSMRPDSPESAAGVLGQGSPRVRVDRRADDPLPQGLEVKPPDLPSLLKGKVVERELTILGRAGHKVFVIRQRRSPEDARPCEAKACAKQPASNESLASDERGDPWTMGVHPQDGDFAFRVTTTEGVAPEGLGGTLVEDPLLSNGGAPHMLSSEKV